MDFSSGITVVNSVSRRTSVVSSVNHNKRVLLKKKMIVAVHNATKSR